MRDDCPAPPGIETFNPWCGERLGLFETSCPACGDVSLQPAGLFHFCIECGITCGSQRKDLLSDRLMRIALRMNRGGALA